MNPRTLEPSQPIELSIIIPIFNEARKIPADIAAATAFLTSAGITGEIIFADDGSTDGSADIATKVGPTPSSTSRDTRSKADEGVGPTSSSILRLPHAGKGSAVRHGILASRGRFVMFADSGVCIPFADALTGLQMLRAEECDIANASRRLPGSVIERPQSRKRAILSLLFRKSMIRLLRLPKHLTDTQCGFKMYKGDIARELYAACATDGFVFDLEILVRAARRELRIKEFPVHWRWDSDSRLRPIRILRNVLGDLRRIRKL